MTASVGPFSNGGNSEPPRILLRAHEARAVLGIGEKTFYRWVRAGVIPSYTDPDTGRRWYPRAAVVAAAERLAGDVA